MQNSLIMWLKLKFYVMAHYEKIFLLFGFTNNYKKIVVLHNFSFMEKRKIVILDVNLSQDLFIYAIELGTCKISLL